VTTAAAKSTPEISQRTAARAASVSLTAAAAAPHFFGSYMLPPAVPGAGDVPASSAGDRPPCTKLTRDCSGGRPSRYSASCRHGVAPAE